MMDRTQETLVVERFGHRAAAYLGSTVHAAGEDLAALAALVSARPGCRVLDLGCGGGHVAYAAAEAGAGEVVACDLSAGMLAVVAAEASRRGLNAIRTKQGSAERLPFDTASFDVVLSRYSAHHWRDFEAGVREAARVLRPSGVAGFADVVSAMPGANDTFLQAVELLRDTSHVRDRSVAEWLDATGRAGLSARADDGRPGAHGVRELDRPHRGAAGDGSRHSRASGGGQRRCPRALRGRSGRQLHHRYGDDDLRGLKRETAPCRHGAVFYSKPGEDDQRMMISTRRFCGSRTPSAVGTRRCV